MDWWTVDWWTVDLSTGRLWIGGRLTGGLVDADCKLVDGGLVTLGQRTDYQDMVLIQAEESGSK